MPPGLALRLTFIRSNYPCLEHIFMAPKVFEPLKFYCIYRCVSWHLVCPSSSTQREEENIWNLVVVLILVTMVSNQLSGMDPLAVPQVPEEDHSFDTIIIII